MPIFTVIAWVALSVAVLSFIIAFLGKRQFYWMSAFAIYVFSFIAGFSIGQRTVGLTFIPLTLAIGYSSGWLKTNRDYLLTVGAGLLIGVLVVMFVDDSYTFFPFTLIAKLFDV